MKNAGLLVALAALVFSAGLAADPNSTRRPAASHLNPKNGSVKVCRNPWCCPTIPCRCTGMNIRG